MTEIKKTSSSETLGRVSRESGTSRECILRVEIKKYALAHRESWESERMGSVLKKL